MRELASTLIARSALALAFAGLTLACNAARPPKPVSVLLFTGDGTSPSDVAAVKRILENNRLAYATATSAQLNRMSAAELTAYRLVVVPGGNFIRMSASLSPQTTQQLHDAVQAGVNYLGICAGAFLAGDGRGYYNSLNLTSGVRFGFYSAEKTGIRKAAIVVRGADSTAIEHYWEDGPELTGWGDVVGKYPDGTPAVVEALSGRGWVILAGVHPEAPESWRRGMTFATPASAANEYAGALVRAALTQSRLPHY